MFSRFSSRMICIVCTPEKRTRYSISQWSVCLSYCIQDGPFRDPDATTKRDETRFLAMYPTKGPAARGRKLIITTTAVRV